MQFSDAYKTCVYTLANPAALVQFEPTAIVINATQVAVPCKLEPMQRLAKIGFPAVSPIHWEYDWPGEFRPWPQQLQMAAFHTLHPRSFNLSDMRTGKTMSTLWAADYLMLKGQLKKMLIDCPLSTVNRVWERDIFRNFMGRRRMSILLGTKQRRLERLDNEADFYLINHDGLGIGCGMEHRRFKLGELAARIAADGLINGFLVDEGSKFRDPGTNLFRALQQTTLEKPIYWHLTGTPTPKEPPNAWSQAKLVRRSELTEDYNLFRTRTMYRLTQFRSAPRAGSYELAKAIMQPAIRFNRFDCHGTLPIEPEIIPVELTAAQTRAMQELRTNLQITLQHGPITAINEAALRIKLLQISCGAVYGAAREVSTIDCAPRIAAVKEIIDASPHKIIVFAPFTNVVNLVHSELSKDYEAEMIYGATPTAKRNKIFQAFQDTSSPRVIVADPGTMNYGLTLTAADTIIWYGPTDKPEVYTQANCRIEGSTQKDTAAIFCLTSTPVEREIFRRLENREDLQGAMLSLVEGE